MGRRGHRQHGCRRGGERSGGGRPGVAVPPAGGARPRAAAFADAFRACAEYKEMPYAVRRRRADQPADERIRLSEQSRDIQARLSYYQAWTASECDGVGAAYNTLVTAVRSHAGGATRDAWTGPALDNDPGMNLSPELINLSAFPHPSWCSSQQR